MSDNSAFPLMISVVVMNPTQLASVYALLGGAAIAVAQSAPGNASSGAAKQGTAQSSGTAETLAPANPESAGTGPSATNDASLSDDSGELDAHGHPWSPELHASTKGKTKDGLWRMKVGVTRPDPKPGFPVDNGASSAGTGTSSETPAPSATSQPATEPASAPAATSGPEAGEDDEFAAFRAASAASDVADQAAAASVPPRQYSDADLGALCNQAAVKLGDPEPVKQIIARYVPAGEVAHSRNIPADRRTEFVKEVEAKAGIEFAG